MPGCRHAVADAMMRDSRLAPPGVNNPNEPMWAMFSRWLVSLHGERHRAMRARFQSMFVPRRVAVYRAGMSSSSIVLRIDTSHSLPAPTFASALRWLGCMRRSRFRRCSNAFPSFPWQESRNGSALCHCASSNGCT